MRIKTIILINFIFTIKCEKYISCVCIICAMHLGNIILSYVVVVSIGIVRINSPPPILPPLALYKTKLILQ